MTTASGLSADVVVIGAGTAGSLLAHRLAKAGVTVAILEAGPRIDRASAVVNFLASPTKTPNSPYPPNSIAFQPDSGENNYVINDGVDRFNGLYLRGVGGTTWHMGGTAMRYRPSDFRTRTLFGVGLDWPISYDDLAPWYGEAERETGVAGDAAFDWGAPRQGAYPMPGVPATYLDKSVANVLPALGLSMRVFPQFRNSVDFDNRPACCGNASCEPICPIGAKWDGSVAAAKAEAAGARLVPDALVTTLEVGADGQLSHARFRRPDGSTDEATGRVFVLAAHAIETPRLLLASRSAQAPSGVANSSGAVGRYLMGQIDQVAIGLTRDPVYPYRGPLGTSGIVEFRDGPFRKSEAAIGTSVSNAGWMRALGPLVYAAEQARHGVRGAPLAHAVARHAARELMIGSTAEMLPNPDNRVVADFDRRDGAGMPRPRVTFRIDDYAKRGLANAMARQDRILAALGCTETRTFPMGSSTAIILGTARMGTDPRSSVVDPELRAHDHRNLFVVGGSAFPASGVLPPTLTIAALALRTADTIKASLRT